MKKIFLLAIVLSFTVGLSTSIAKSKTYNGLSLLNQNISAFEEPEIEGAVKKCSYRGFLGFRKCEISCEGCSYVTCDRTGCVAH